ncbi:hypothetical protein [Desulfovibrio oxyclinae]|uniref:hypothetical protein n=1 Tax=Desulfovibrio oxyclinae TaxID=63560 RepID=UPI001FDF992F|nr:hypothetical protein [Desulfovibrio oxyclinae]
MLVRKHRGELLCVRITGEDPRGFWVGRQLRGPTKGATRLFKREQVVAVRTEDGYRRLLCGYGE